MAGVTSAGNSDDVVVNADMLEDPNGDMVAVAWGHMTPWPWGGTMSPTANFYVSDFSCNSVPGGMAGGFGYRYATDIVLANAPDPVSGATGYQALTVYENYNFLTFTFEAWLDIWDINNVGTPGISLTLRTPSILLSSNCNGFPHIDMWSDAANPVNGHPGMHEFAVVWAEGTTGNLGGWFADVNAPSPIGMPLTIGSNAYMPDVAAFTDMNSGDKKIKIALGQGVGTPYSTAYGGRLFVTEYNVSNPALTPTPITPGTLLDSRPVLAPKIEAMSQYIPTAGLAQWQIAATIHVGGIPAYVSQVYGYNSIVPAATDMSSLLAPLYPLRCL